MTRANSSLNNETELCQFVTSKTSHLSKELWSEVSNCCVIKDDSEFSQQNLRIPWRVHQVSLDFRDIR